MGVRRYEGVEIFTDERFAECYPLVQQERGLILGVEMTKLTKNWDKKGKILIPGYGRGGTMLDLWMRGFNNYYGLDLNLAALRSGRLENRVVGADMNKMPFSENSFDYAVITDVLQDVGDFGDLVGSLRNIARTVRKGGQILVINPTAESYGVETKLFDCSRFPENRTAIKVGMGREAEGVIKTVDNKGEKGESYFVDHVWRDRDLEKAFGLADLKRIVKRKPLARDDNRFPNWMGVHDWISETKVAPWVVYLLEVK